MPCVGTPSLSTGCDDSSKTSWRRNSYSRAQAKPNVLNEEKTRSRRKAWDFDLGNSLGF